MSLLRTSPNKFSSDPNIPSLVEKDYSIVKKRKQCETTMECFDRSSNEQPLLWNSKITECIANSVTVAVNAALTNELSKISNTLAEINTNIIRLNSDNINIHKTMSEINKQLNEIEKSMQFASERQDQFDNRLKSVEDKSRQIMDTAAQISCLETKLSTLEQQARQCNIEIANMPERRGENLINTIANLGNIIKCPIGSTDIIAVHRVPHADQKNTRPKNVIVKFTNRMLRDNILAAYRAMKGLDSTMLSINGSKTIVYLNEHLTLANKQLFRQCRDIAKTKSYKYVWIKHGTILVRKMDTSPVIAIRSTQDLNRIK